MSSFKAIQTHPTRALHAIPTNAPSMLVKRTINGQSVNVPKHHYVTGQTRKTVKISPSSAVPTSLLNSGMLDFKVNSSGSLDMLDHAYIKIVATNNTGASLSIVPSYLWPDRIDIKSGNGGIIMSQQSSQELFLQNIFLTQEQHLNLNAEFGSTDAYATAGVALADGDSITRYILISSFLTPTDLCLSGLTGDISFTITFRPTALTHTAGALIDVDSADLYLKGKDEDEVLTAARNKIYRNEITLMPYQAFQRFTVTQALAASSTYNIILTGINGIIGSVFWVIRAAAITGANQCSYSANISTFDINDANGASMTGFVPRTRTEALMDAAELFPNEFLSNINLNVICFGDDPMGDFQTGSNSGSAVFTGNEKLVFTTNASMASASYEIDVYGLSFEHLRIEKGTARPSR